VKASPIASVKCQPPTLTIIKLIGHLSRIAKLSHQKVVSETNAPTISSDYVMLSKVNTASIMTNKVTIAVLLIIIRIKTKISDWWRHKRGSPPQMTKASSSTNNQQHLIMALRTKLRVE